MVQTVIENPTPTQEQTPAGIVEANLPHIETDAEVAVKLVAFIQAHPEHAKAYMPVVEGIKDSKDKEKELAQFKSQFESKLVKWLSEGKFKDMLDRLEVKNILIGNIAEGFAIKWNTTTSLPNRDKPSGIPKPKVEKVIYVGKTIDAMIAYDNYAEVAIALGIDYHGDTPIRRLEALGFLVSKGTREVEA